MSKKIIEDTENACKAEIEPIQGEIKTLQESVEKLRENHKGKKDDEIPVPEKEDIKTKESKITELKKKEEDLLSTYAKSNNLVRQLVDLALLSNNMLKGEALSQFVKRSVELL